MSIKGELTVKDNRLWSKILVDVTPRRSEVRHGRTPVPWIRVTAGDIARNLTTVEMPNLIECLCEVCGGVV